MYFFQQFSGVQSRNKSMTIFQLFNHKQTGDTIRILVIMRTLKCRELALMALRNEEAADGGDVIIIATKINQGDPNSKLH